MNHDHRRTQIQGGPHPGHDVVRRAIQPLSVIEQLTCLLFIKRLAFSIKPSPE